MANEQGIDALGSPKRARGSGGVSVFARVDDTPTRIVLPVGKHEELVRLAKRDQRSVQGMVDILIAEAKAARKTSEKVSSIASADSRSFSHMASILVEEAIEERAKGGR